MRDRELDARLAEWLGSKPLDPPRGWFTHWPPPFSSDGNAMLRLIEALRERRVLVGVEPYGLLSEGKWHAYTKQDHRVDGEWVDGHGNSLISELADSAPLAVAIVADKVREAESDV